MKDLLRNSMLALYSDNDTIYDALLQVDWSKLNYKFQQELFLRISPDRFYAMDEVLRSDAYIEYRDAIDRAAQACSNDLANLLEFVVSENENGGAN